MRNLKGIIAYKKDGTLVEFDDREEYLKEFNSKEYKRVWATASDIMATLYNVEDKVDELETELACLR